MSDSEVTLPADDDFESRFLEIDDGQDMDENVPLPISLTRIKVSRTPVNARKRQQQRCKKTPSKTKSRSSRQRRRPRVSEVFTGSDSSEEFPDKIIPTARSRTRTGYISSQSSLWTLEDLAAPLERGDPGQASAQSTTLTPEQLEVRRRRIERRRESAKTKADKEMQETVERLLRVNTEYGSNTNGRGSAAFARNGAVSSSAESSDDESVVGGQKKKKKMRNALQPSMPLDPPTGYVRLISSQRLKQSSQGYPPTLIALPEAHNLLGLSPPGPPLSAMPPLRICEQCRAAPRRYAHPRTGISLCSLECFKAANAAADTTELPSCF